MKYLQWIYHVVTKVYRVDNTKCRFLTIDVVYMQKLDLQPLAKRIGQAIANERLKKGFTQESLAEKLGVEKETISRFERGAILPPLPRLAQLADVLSVPLTNLIRRTSARPTDQAQELGQHLEGLAPADRELVTRWFVEVCQRLTSKSGSSRKR
jgi:transcriptional regulator with XRE-family HTH domain